MRDGLNPQKRNARVKSTYNHRVITVVYIPQLEGYYAEMFEVFKLSIKSLIKTLPKTSAITVVDNSSCKRVQEYQIELHKDGKIESLVLLADNIGKIDAQIGAARMSREPLITLTDCDILFGTNWVQDTFKIFNSIPETGSVAPYPSRRSLTYATFSVQKAILKGKYKLEFEPIPENFENYNKFLESINWHKEINQNALWPILNKGSVKAIVGSDHQVLTLRRDILFSSVPFEPSFIKVGNHSEENYVDFPIDISGYFRLSLSRYSAFHMGNSPEQWMYDMLDALSGESENLTLNLIDTMEYPKLRNSWVFKLKKKIIKKIFKFYIPKTYHY
ncbi:glycosyl transferase family 2 [Leeuwenhoekiella aestuarii]|uniref:glycosyltransferase n=1 Tax=Leeuwenhoekiella aestuarii TaxID=2249426 RepID=UPI000FFF58A7|nr:glycosyltransferase [Leeuwenhoekiella aestuarii]RXG13763.1 glycosyl transferase family 2 [Leeuwenhoekiella aestuarii]